MSVSLATSSLSPSFDLAVRANPAHFTVCVFQVVSLAKRGKIVCVVCEEVTYLCTQSMLLSSVTGKGHTSETAATHTAHAHAL